MALRWLGNGSQYNGIGDMHGVSKATVCRSVQAVVNAVNTHLFPKLVDWPNRTKAEHPALEFHALGGMSCVCGCIDGTLINIDAPKDNEVAFVDREGNHSINCMLVCGPDFRFYCASCRRPGSVNDARVLRTSSLMARMEAGWRPFPHAIILGDSAYPLKAWLIPPLHNDPNNATERKFNRTHKATRRVIENAIGILKEKLPCLSHLRVSPIYAGDIVKTCVTLSNISKEGNEESFCGYADDGDGDEIPNEDEPTQDGMGRLNQLLQHFQ